MLIIRVSKKFNSIMSPVQKRQMIGLFFLMIMGGLLEMMSVSLVLPFMNAVMAPQAFMDKWYAKAICQVLSIDSAKDFLMIAAIILAAVYIVKNIFLLLEYNIQYKFVYGTMFEMQRKLLENYIHRPYEFFLKASSGNIIRVVNTDTPNVFNMLSTLLGFYTELVVMAILISTIFVMTPMATLAMTIILLLMMLIISKFVKPILRKAGEDNQRSAAGMNKWLLQSIQGIKEIKIQEREEYFQSQYEEYGRIHVNALRKNLILSIVPRFFIEAISMGTMFIVIAVMIWRGRELETVIPILTAVGVAAIRMLPSVNRMTSYIGNVAYNEPMLDKLIENLTEVTEADLDKSVVQKSKKNRLNGRCQLLKNSISMLGIWYKYPDNKDNVLRDADLRIEIGESVGIVGESGAGKTTAVDIILGLLKPQRGIVTMDESNIEMDLSEWHHRIGYIPQAIFMLDDSIRENITFGINQEKISEEKIWQALEEASLDEFVRRLPEGLDTQIGERGVRLSGGQKQRIGIARALYNDPEILVFDEATSALDNETEASIMESINKFHGQKTMIIIAHRLTTIKNCDHVYRVENGKIQKER